VTRIGIELSPDACRIVEIDPAPAWERRRGATRVRSFAVLPPSGPETDAMLRSLRNRQAAVVLWTVTGDHPQILVPPGLQPLLTAGIRVRTVMTSGAALGSLARLRRESWTPNAMEVFVALEERVTCIALVRGGMLIASRDLGWGYVDEFGSDLEPRRREDIATRLVDAIRDFVDETGGARADIKDICVCGGHPELRSVTALLIEQLDVEFEPLDSLFGIDAARLPEPVDEFRERSAELRLAWAAAADSPPTMNLFLGRNLRASRKLLAPAAILAAVAALLIVGWRVQCRWSHPAASTGTADKPSSAPRGDAPKATVDASTGPPVVNEMPQAVAPPAAVGGAAAAARETPAPVGQQPARLRATPARPLETALPFDALLGGILYSPDRKLAIVDGRIVGAGDEVRGARIIDITPGAVILRDGQGHLRKLTMHSRER
jgi:hypothetical protein